MKWFLKMVIIAACLHNASGCVVETESYAYRSPAAESFRDVYDYCVNDLFRAAELAVFFREYTRIREDRPASEQLAHEYFGNRWSELYYEFVSVSGIGILRPGDGDGTYVFCPGSLNSEKLSYEVTTSDGRSFSLSCVSESFRSSADIVIEDMTLTMYGLEVEYYESGDVMTISSDSGSNVSMPRCDSGGFCYMPVSGRYSVSIEGNRVSDRYSVEFFRDKVTFIRDGSTEDFPVDYFNPLNSSYRQ